jgi:hypothetical protein
MAWQFRKSGGRGSSRKQAAVRRHSRARRVLPTLEPLEDRHLMATNTLTPVADAFMRDGDYSSLNSGLDSALIVKNDELSSRRTSILQFDLAQIQGSVTRATLRLHPTNAGKAGITHALALVSNDNWSEKKITWENKPESGGAVEHWQVQSGQVVEVDVTALVQGELAGDHLLSLEIFSPDYSGPDGWATYGSREASADVRPVLEITSDATPIPKE